MIFSRLFKVFSLVFNVCNSNFQIIISLIIDFLIFDRYYFPIQKRKIPKNQIKIRYLSYEWQIATERYT